MRKLTALVIGLAFAIPLFGASEVIPRTKGTTLDGKAVSLPEAGSKKQLLLVLSFSHKATGDVEKWSAALHGLYAQGSVDYYELDDFEGVPSFVMRMILHGMRRSIPEPERSHVVPFFKQEKSWKNLVQYSRANIAYVVLTDAEGNVVAQVRGPFETVKAARLKQALEDSRK